MGSEVSAAVQPTKLASGQTKVFPGVQVVKGAVGDQVASVRRPVGGQVGQGVVGAAGAMEEDG